MKSKIINIEMRLRIFFMIVLSVLSLNSITAQKRNPKITITGTVMDAYKNPVVNSIIIIDGKNTSSMTDSKGNYKIKVKRDAKRIGIISFSNGMIEEVIDGRAEINFTYGTAVSRQQPVQAGKESEEVVNAGYNNVKQKDLTNRIDKIDGTNKKYASYSSVSEMITREVSGVRHTSSGYVILDSKDFFGSVPALLIVDGVPVDNFDGISPSSVESIEALKGSAAAIYGSRGYGGAIVIKTRIKNN